MSENEKTKLQMIEIQVTDIETKLDSTIKITEDTNDRVKKIETGLFGDSDLEHKGIIEKQRSVEERITKIEDRVFNVEQVNEKQEINISAKKEQEDAWEKNLKRVFWGLLVSILFVFLISGKIGVADIINGFLK